MENENNARMEELRLENLREQLENLITERKELNYKSAEEVMQFLVDLMRTLNTKYPQGTIKNIHVFWENKKIDVRTYPVNVVEGDLLEKIENTKMQEEEWEKLKNTCSKIEKFEKIGDAFGIGL